MLIVVYVFLFLFIYFYYSIDECPSDEDPKSATNPGLDNEYRDCSGRGICDYTTGLCTCFEGYYGTACETAATLQ